MTTLRVVKVIRAETFGVVIPYPTRCGRILRANPLTFDGTKKAASLDVGAACFFVPLEYFDTAKKGQKYGTAKYLGKKVAIKAKKAEKTEKSSNFAVFLRPCGLCDLAV